MIIHADSFGTDGLESLTEPVDHLITDPPYSAYVHSKTMRGTHGAGDSSVIYERHELGFESITEEQMRALADHAKRLVKRWILIFSDLESTHLWRQTFQEAGLEYIRTGLWHKINGAPQFTGDRPAVACEAIIIFHQPGRKKWNGGGQQAFWQYPIVVPRNAGKPDRLHPTQKPEGLMRELVTLFSDRGETILDPFAGSGTTLNAAKATGRKYIGIEQNEQHYQTCLERVERIKVRDDAQLTIF